MKSRIPAVRGMPVILPAESGRRQHIEKTLLGIVAHFAYREIRLPLIERTELFARSIGETTEILEKEMYSFADRNRNSLSLRPEATAGMVRACLEYGLLQDGLHRLWSLGPMFRYERPQSGRARQFDQLDVEAIGTVDPDSTTAALDAELIWMNACFWQTLELPSPLHLQINALGNEEARRNYNRALRSFLARHQTQLDEDSRRRLNNNPLRILDSKVPATRALLANAPAIADYWDEATRQHLTTTCQLLNELDISYEVNPLLVRGLDYYDKLVFEWNSADLGAQNTVCAGGRYDRLIEQLGGKPTPASGFAVGMERLLLILSQSLPAQDGQQPQLFFIGLCDTAKLLRIRQQLRQALPSLRIECNFSSTSLKSQLRRAHKSAAQYVLIVGEEEIAQKKFLLRNMANSSQVHLNWQELRQHLESLGRDGFFSK